MPTRSVKEGGLADLKGSSANFIAGLASFGVLAACPFGQGSKPTNSKIAGKRAAGHPLKLAYQLGKTKGAALRGGVR